MEITKNNELRKVCSNKNAKILIQSPGKNDILIKDICRVCWEELREVIKDSTPLQGPGNDYKRARWIRKRMIYIIDAHPVHSIWVRSGLSDGTRAFSNDTTHVLFEDPLTSSYWGLPPASFDAMITTSPVRTEMLKDSGIFIEL